MIHFLMNGRFVKEILLIFLSNYFLLVGIQHVSPIESFPVEKWDLMISLMLSGPFHLTRLFLPHMKQKGKRAKLRNYALA